ncbi:hypothetical protein L226DRAFT_565166 [Lentinus tigrinus ALCF2SS1-7]|uniref:uncharacterized protein n=1 Tax=Lentinus tigrinus ALCF2SS1-7 TaxID=1328758 RepID=UPI0011660E62|nr:hypothetical protein L226DRAFT_565166 [Lentinus tigrinus ALCF2SS1-7]
MLEADTQATLAYHPLFSDGDLVLKSRDNTFFRVSRETLSRTSPWFRAMLTLPQTEPVEPISMDEPADLLAGLLAIVSGIELPSCHNFDHLESLLRVAEKYEMPMAISALRLSLFSPLTDVPSPIRLYGIACRMSWEGEAKLASSRTLGIDLLTPAALAELALLEPPYRDKLVVLHRQRKDQFIERLNDMELFYANQRGRPCNVDDPTNECTAIIEHSAWTAFKYAMLMHLEYAPLGTAFDEDAYNLAEMEELRYAQCPACSRHLYNVGSTIAKLHAIVKGLPKSIELS